MFIYWLHHLGRSIFVICGSVVVEGGVTACAAPGVLQCP